MGAQAGVVDHRHLSGNCFASANTDTNTNTNTNTNGKIQAGVVDHRYLTQQIFCIKCNIGKYYETAELRLHTHLKA